MPSDRGACNGDIAPDYISLDPDPVPRALGFDAFILRLDHLDTK
ncbi:MAG: hypothetical protein WC740_12635 [Verrucomicrobiia bacterium]